MVTTLVHGISSMIDNAEGAIVQTAEIDAKVEETKVSGMDSGTGKTQIKKVFEHSNTNEFNVTGHGDLTLTPGVQGTVAGSHFSSGFITGGKVMIRSFKYKQQIGEASDWGYNGTHYPYAT